MALTDNLKTAIETQKKALAQLEAEVMSLSESELAAENNSMKAELEALKKELSDLSVNCKNAGNEISALKNALYEQIYNEKMSIINATSKRLDAYFEANYEGQLNRLSELEKTARRRIDEITRALKENNIGTSDEIYTRLDELSVLLNKKLTAARVEYAKNKGAFSENEGAELEALKNEQITDDIIRKVVKKNNFEAFVGLNLINKLGILLIIIGVIAASQYSYFQLPPHLKGIMMFSIGLLLLVGGEVMNRKTANIFSLGLTGGGVAILYVALSVSYFGLKILDMYPAIILCVLITAGSFVLSQRYNSQTVAAFALVGGYLPIFSALDNITTTYSAMVYFIVLNAFALFTAFRKKWSVAMFIGFFLNLIATAIIAFNMADYRADGLNMKSIIALVYVVFSFLIYTAIPIVSTYYSKIKLRRRDVTLLSLNTFFSALIIYGLLYELNLTDYTGLLALIFAVVYLGLGRVIEMKLSDEKSVRALFYLTGDRKSVV